MGEEKHKGERIAKRMARAGVCSRRDAERWITQGRVKVNKAVIDSPALNVTDDDDIRVDGKPLPRKQHTRLFLYHKPPGLVTTHRDEQGRSTVFDELPDFIPRVISVGRLDLNTEGLLLLTNDGELSRFLELPSTGWKRKYRVRVNGKVNDVRLKSLKNGITVEGVRYQSIEAYVEDAPEEQERTGANSWISVTLREGKNREIRRVMEALGLKVTRLIRTDYGPFSLGKMNRGGVNEVSPDLIQKYIPEHFDRNSLVKNEKDVQKEKEVFSKKRGQNTHKSEKNSYFDKKNTKFNKKTKK